MSIANTGIKRRPTHPGEMLREDFLPDYDLTVSGLAEAIASAAHAWPSFRRSWSPRWLRPGEGSWLVTATAMASGTRAGMMAAEADGAAGGAAPVRTHLQKRLKADGR